MFELFETSSDTNNW